LGTSDNVAEHLHRADCVVLPSYREGTPKTLLEAAACGKPLITTDVPGCRETVEHGRNGYLCQVRDAADLATKLLLMAQLPPQRLAVMGEASRELAAEKFDEKLVLQQYLTAVTEAGQTK
jgi:glycosyltransferase involved in cell wall biosynthesis